MPPIAQILEKLPTVITVGGLVLIFAFLKRHARSVRLDLWIAGWFLIFLHFAIQIFEPWHGRQLPELLAIDWGALQASAIAFLASLCPIVDERGKRILVLAGLGVPSVGYFVLSAYGVPHNWPYVLCLILTSVFGLALFWYASSKNSVLNASVILGCMVVMVWAISGACRGSFDEGMTALLGLGFALPGLLLYRNHWRPSAGMFTIVIGFLFWGAVFPVGMLTDKFFPHLPIPAEMWNTPKIFVALGMILAVLEKKSISIASMQRKEHALNVQMERFSSITSKLLGGAKVEEMCDDIARAITAVTNFQIAAIHIAQPGGSLQVAGSSGLDDMALAALREQASRWRVDDVRDFCARARRVGEGSFLMSSSEAEKYTPVKSQRTYEPNSHWNTGDELLLPLYSPRGSCLGCIALDDPRVAEEVNPRELSRIEILAKDLAVALELRSLQNQLVRSEKLAAIGQLVAGVAHELNNPLTAVMGYGELVHEEVRDQRSRERLDRLNKESRRMKKIIDNLLRFARQTSKQRQALSLTPVVQDVLALREYHLKNRNIEIICDLDPDLRVVADEDEMKQVLLNLINNAIDAVEPQKDTRHIIVRAFSDGIHGIMEVEDSGTGFADLNKALDPFYTTKPVGKGTGLGLSICYGIVKEHGGEIRLNNVAPHGACISVELPLALAGEFSGVHGLAAGSPLTH
ncbi:MAG TPA: ATP-binding protein [Terriglobales bacterium]|nr:ATP-binding protein [Terriglobales bacterium]